MGLFFPLATGIATAITLVLTYETGKHAKRKLERKKGKLSHH
ncbi:hypothetical protein [Sulfurospirillum tamanense]|nr:hypothetical protein [Sulfurospirillum tamanensis]